MGLQVFRIEIRMVLTVLWTLLLIPALSFSAEQDSASKKTLLFLQMGFPEKDETMQKNLLRDMALLDTEEAVPFFVGVALNSNYSEDIRREALKGMLAIDSRKYRMVLDVLQASPLDEVKLIQYMQMVDGIDLLSIFLQSLTFMEEQRITEMKLAGVLKFWKNDAVEKFNFSVWPSDKASESLSQSIFSNRSSRQKVHLIQLWGNVRDEKSTKEMVKLLDQSDAKVQEALIFALSKPGPSAVSALGRFLQKSKDATLRKRTIYALRKIGGSTAKTALKSYEPKATKEEKAWIKEILEK